MSMELKKDFDVSVAEIVKFINDGSVVLGKIKRDFEGKKASGSIDRSRDNKLYHDMFLKWKNSVDIAMDSIFPSDVEKIEFSNPTIPIGVKLGDPIYQSITKKFLASIEALIAIKDKMPTRYEREILPENKSKQNINKSEVNFDVVIICALHQPELEKIKSTGAQPWTEVEQDYTDPHSYWSTFYTTKKGGKVSIVAAAPNQMGMPASAVLATKMILRFKPKIVVMTGIAAGVKKEEQEFGDILAAEHTFDYGSGKNKDGKLELEPDPKPLAIEQILLSRLKHWQTKSLDDIRMSWIDSSSRPKNALSLRIGPLGTGGAVQETREPIKQTLHHWRKLIGIEMEAYAVHRACTDTTNPSVKFLCLKSICDFAEEKTNDYQDYAAFTSAKFCHLFLTSEWENLGLDK